MRTDPGKLEDPKTAPKDREIRLAGVLDALFAATDKEVGRLLTIVEQNRIPHEERFQTLVDLARLSSNMVSLLANHKDGVGTIAGSTAPIVVDTFPSQTSDA
jgi:hypothetical protein